MHVALWKYGPGFLNTIQYNLLNLYCSMINTTDFQLRITKLITLYKYTSIYNKNNNNQNQEAKETLFIFRMCSGRLFQLRGCDVKRAVTECC